jgi:hypothetical protein
MTQVGNVYQFTVFIPPFAAPGSWLPEFSVSDLAGNITSYTYSQLAGIGYDLALGLLVLEEETVLANETVTTDPENDGATPLEPFEASVTSPVEGVVSITQLDLTDPVSTNDYQVFNQQYDIDAPEATAADPLVLRFSVDASSLAGQTAETVEVFRNGVLVNDCTDPEDAVPDPCVAERNTLGDGDVELVVRTSRASIASTERSRVDDPKSLVRP